MTARSIKRTGYIWVPLLFILGSLILFILMKAGHMKIPQCRIHRYLLAKVSPVQKEIAAYYYRSGRFPDVGELATEAPAVTLESGGRLRVELSGLFPELTRVGLCFEPRIEASSVHWFCRIDAPPHFNPKKVLPKNIRNGCVWDAQKGPSMWDTFGLFLLIPIWGLVTAVIALWETLQAT